MPIKVEIYSRASLMLVDAYGLVTFDERLEMFDRILHAIAKHDIREITSDLSMMDVSNHVLDELYFGEVLNRQAHVFRPVRNTIIHPSGFHGTGIPAATLKGNGCKVDEFHIGPDAPLESLKIG